MDMLETLNARRSVKADLLTSPAPNREELVEILQTGMSAPDHGALRPWRFKVIEGDKRKELGELFAQAMQQDNPEAAQEDLDAIKKKPLRAPLIVAIWAEITENHPKVPPVEQIVTTAMATENIMLAAQAKGFGAVLLTGWPAFHAHIQQALGMSEKDEMVGFLYLGTASEAPRPMKRVDVTDYLSDF